LPLGKLNAVRAAFQGRRCALTNYSAIRNFTSGCAQGVGVGCCETMISGSAHPSRLSLG
jgi:hypothetical protein